MSDPSPVPARSITPADLRQISNFRDLDEQELTNIAEQFYALADIIFERFLDEETRGAGGRSGDSCQKEKSTDPSSAD